MAQDVTLSMDGLLLNWLKEPGQAVKAGEVIAEFEADKATVEVEAPADGVLSETLVDIGAEVKEGTVIARIGGSGEAKAGAAASASGGAAAGGAAGAAATASGGAAAGGAAAGGKAGAGGAAGAAQSGASSAGASASGGAAAATNGNGNGAARTEDGRIKASPLARNVAEDKGVDLAQVAGSGPGGRIIKKDVDGFDPSKGMKTSAASAAPAASSEAGMAMAFQSYGKLPEGDDVEISDISRMRKLIAKGTVTSFNTTPHFYVTVEVDVEALLKLRGELNKQLEAQGVKISVNDMVVKAIALALRQFPNLNTHYYGEKLVRHKRINVSIAVSLPNNGLVNVVSPDADKTTLSAMAVYHAKMFADAREGKIKPEYVQNATFLVSNLGAYNVESFSAIIDPPLSAALAVGAAKKVPVVNADGTLGVGNRMKVTLSIDHRISDGAEGAQFLQLFRELIENPMRLLI